MVKMRSREIRECDKLTVNDKMKRQKALMNNLDDPKLFKESEIH
jgi:hypothetical protein